MSTCNNLAKTALGLALAALPGIAQAGTATATGTAVLNVINECSVTGATVNLGMYASSNTVGDVAADLGSWEGGVYTPGKRGQEYLTWGSVTCDAGTPYTLSIRGTSVLQYSPGGIRFEWPDPVSGSYTSIYDMFVKKIGNTTVADSNAAIPGAGANVNISPAAGIGTGTAQMVLGSVAWSYDASRSQPSTALPAGALSDQLSCTLNF